jgi:coenzyme PQQ precursor peptide PqqA
VTEGAPEPQQGETIMAWTRPKLREVCIGLEISGYLPGSM